MPKKIEDLDERIREAIAGFDGVPAAKGLARKLGLSRMTVQPHLDSSPFLIEAMQARGTEYLNSLSEPDFLKKFSSTGWSSQFPDYAKELVNRRISEILLVHIQAFDGVPTTNSLARKLGISDITIQHRLGSNPSLAEAMETRGTEYLNALTEPDFLKKLSSIGWLPGLPDYARALADRRINGIMLTHIQSFDGVPTTTGLAKRIGLSPMAVQYHLDSSPFLKEAMQARGTEYLNSLSEPDFLKKFSSLSWFRNPTVYVKALIDKRIDAILSTNIPSFDGVPSVEGLARKIGISNIAIRPRLDSNPSLAEAMETRGTEYLNSLSEPDFLKKFSSPNWFRNISVYAKESADKRIARIILANMQSFDGVPTANRLARKIGITHMTVQHRLDSNPDLWTAFYAKCGLTPDQAIELALERREQTNSLDSMIRMRLKNLHGFREMVGVLKCFTSECVGKSVLHISFYTDALKKAAEELGLGLEVAFSQLTHFRKSEAVLLPKAGCAVVQSIHRLDSQALTTLIRSTYEALLGEGVLIATYGKDYFPASNFEDALSKSGFSLEHSGTLVIAPPSKSVMLDFGVTEEDVNRLRAKMDGESSVLILRKISHSSEVAIPELEKVPMEQGTREGVLNGTVINTPDGLASRSTFSFFEDAKTLSACPFLIEVLANGSSAALLGFDMNAKKPNKIETVIYPGAPAEDFRKIAMQLATRNVVRKAFGIKPNEIKKLNIGELKAKAF